MANSCCIFFFFNDTATTEIYTLSLHDALPIWVVLAAVRPRLRTVLVGLSLLALGLDMVHAPFSIVHPPPITNVNRMTAETTGGILALPTAEWDASGTVMISSIFRETIQEYLSTASFHPIVNGVGSLV